MKSFDPYIKQLEESGRKILSDTKTPKKSVVSKKQELSPEQQGDPYEVFIKRTIVDKPAKEDIVKELERFIKVKEKEI
jgi:hypothetical protein